MSWIKIRASIFLWGLMLVPLWGHSYSFLAWGGMTGAKTFSLLPFYSVDFNTGAGTSSFVFGYGLSDRVDITLDISYQYIMTRYDLFGNNLAILGLSLGNSPGLALHGSWDTREHFALVYNVSYTTSSWDFRGSDASFLLTPVLKLGSFGFWLEGQANSVVNAPSYQLAAGMYAYLGDNMLSLGAIDLTGPAAGIGAWLWIPISVK